VNLPNKTSFWKDRKYSHPFLRKHRLRPLQTTHKRSDPGKVRELVDYRAENNGLDHLSRYNASRADNALWLAQAAKAYTLRFEGALPVVSGRVGNDLHRIEGESGKGRWRNLPNKNAALAIQKASMPALRDNRFLADKAQGKRTGRPAFRQGMKALWHKALHHHKTRPSELLCENKPCDPLPTHSNSRFGRCILFRRPCNLLGRLGLCLAEKHTTALVRNAPSHHKVNSLALRGGKASTALRLGCCEKERRFHLLRKAFRHRILFGSVC